MSMVEPEFLPQLGISLTLFQEDVLQEVVSATGLYALLAIAAVCKDAREVSKRILKSWQVLRHPSPEAAGFALVGPDGAGPMAGISMALLPGSREKPQIKQLFVSTPALVDLVNLRPDPMYPEGAEPYSKRCCFRAGLSRQELLAAGCFDVPEISGLAHVKVGPLVVIFACDTRNGAVHELAMVPGGPRRRQMCHLGTPVVRGKQPPRSLALAPVTEALVQELSMPGATGMGFDHGTTEAPTLRECPHLLAEEELAALRQPRAHLLYVVSHSPCSGAHAVFAYVVTPGTLSTQTSERNHLFAFGIAASHACKPARLVPGMLEPSLREPADIAVHGNEVFVTDAHFNRVVVFTLAGRALRVIGGDAPGTMTCIDHRRKGERKCFEVRPGEPLANGAKVLLVRLQQKDLNNQRGTIAGYNEANGRHQVALSKSAKTVLVKASNLLLLEDDAVVERRDQDLDEYRQQTAERQAGDWERAGRRQLFVNPSALMVKRDLLFVCDHPYVIQDTSELLLRDHQPELRDYQRTSFTQATDYDRLSRNFAIEHGAAQTAHDGRRGIQVARVQVFTLQGQLRQVVTLPYKPALVTPPEEALPSRRTNGYFIFATNEHERIRDRRPEATQQELDQMLSKSWEKLSCEKRESFFELAEAINSRWPREHGTVQHLVPRIGGICADDENVYVTLHGLNHGLSIDEKECPMEKTHIDVIRRCARDGEIRSIGLIPHTTLPDIAQSFLRHGGQDETEPHLEVSLTLDSSSVHERGKSLFQEGDVAGALVLFEQAVTMCHQEGGDAPARYYSNLSLALFRTSEARGWAGGGLVRALLAADCAIAVKPAWSRGYARAGNAFTFLARRDDSLLHWMDARESHMEALRLDPDNTVYTINLAAVNKGLRLWHEKFAYEHTSSDCLSEEEVLELTELKLGHRDCQMGFQMRWWWRRLMEWREAIAPAFGPLVRRLRQTRIEEFFGSSGSAPLSASCTVPVLP